VKEGAFWRGSAFRVIAVGGVLITAAAIALCTPWFGLVDLREVVITGNRHAAAADLVSLSGLQRGQSLLATSLRRVSANLLRHPWVKSVSLQRRLPHTLLIAVREREEVAWMSATSNDGCLTIAEGGVIVSSDCERGSSLIELLGARLSGSRVGASLVDAAVVDLIDRLGGGELASLGVERIDLTDPGSVELQTGSGIRILLGGTTDVSSRLDSLAALCRSLDIEDYEVIDLRFGGEATLVPR
jgi:cell division septal protein FtsQ